MLRATFAAPVLAFLVACAAGQEPAAHGPPAKSPPPAPEPAAAKKLDETTPDPITRPLDEAMARREASRLAEQAFAGRTDILDAANKPVGPQKFPPEDFIGGLEGDRWKFRDEPPAGAWARVSFGKFGESPEVEVGFATE